MSILKDKTYESMDWLSQAVEPYHCPLNDILAALPDEYAVPSAKIIVEIVNSYDNDLHIGRIIDSLLPWDVAHNLAYDDKCILNACFKFETSSKIIVKPNAGTVDGEIKIVKVKNLIDEAEVKEMMLRRARINLSYQDCSIEAINDLGRLLLKDDELKLFNSVTKKGKFYTLATFISKSAEADTFKIRSVNAFSAMMTLLEEYLKTGALAKLGEIYKVIMMAKAGQVVYTVGGK